MQPKENGFDSRTSSPEPVRVFSFQLTILTEWWSQDEDVLDYPALSRMEVPERRRRSVPPSRQSTPGSSASASTLVPEEPVQFILLGQKVCRVARLRLSPQHPICDRPMSRHAKMLLPLLAPRPAKKKWMSPRLRPSLAKGLLTLVAMRKHL